MDVEPHDNADLNELRRRIRTERKAKQRDRYRVVLLALEGLTRMFHQGSLRWIWPPSEVEVFAAGGDWLRLARKTPVPPEVIRVVRWSGGGRLRPPAGDQPGRDPAEERLQRVGAR